MLQVRESAVESAYNECTYVRVHTCSRYIRTFVNPILLYICVSLPFVQGVCLELHISSACKSLDYLNKVFI